MQNYQIMTSYQTFGGVELDLMRTADNIPKTIVFLISLQVLQIFEMLDVYLKTAYMKLQ